VNDVMVKCLLTTQNIFIEKNREKYKCEKM